MAGLVRSSPWRRRQFLGLAFGSLGSLALLAACGGSAAPTAANTTASSVASASSAPATSASSSAANSATSAAPAPTSTPVAQGSAQAKGVTITLSYRGGNEPYFAERAKAFSAANPDIAIDKRPFAGSNTDYYPKLTTALASGTADDVFWVSTGFGNYQLYAWNKQLIGVDDLLKANKVDMSQWFKAAIDTLTLDGKLYALPWGMHPDEIGLYYNKELLQKNGVEPPGVNSETYDSLATKSVKLTSRAGDTTSVWGIYTAVGAYSTGLISYVRSFGGDFMTPDKKQPAIDSPQAMAALQWLSDLRVKQRSNPRASDKLATNNSMEDTFVSGNIAMFNGGVWEMALLDKIKGHFTMEMSLIPKGPTGIRGSMAHVDTISGYAQGKHQDEAFKLIEFLTNTESGVQNALVNSFFGARPEVWADPRPKQKYGPMVDTWSLGTQASMALDEPYNFRLVELNDAMDKALGPLWNGDTTPSGVAPTVIAAMNAVLSKPRG